MLQLCTEHCDVEVVFWHPPCEGVTYNVALSPTDFRWLLILNSLGMAGLAQWQFKTYSL